MHRRKLLSQLEIYQTHYPNEQRTVERFYDLIHSHENCFDRDCWAGHITGSAWLVNPAQDSILLTHHRKLNMWLQLGGHSDGDPDTQAVARREANEESGLPVHLCAQDILDIDVHEIPARKSDPAHFHFDVRFSFVAEHNDFVVSSESMALAWVPIRELERRTEETSILRMRDKWLNLHGDMSLG